MALEHPNELRVIYVSVDVDEQWYKAGVKGQVRLANDFPL